VAHGGGRRLFGTFTAFVANAFVNPSNRTSTLVDELRSVVDRQEAVLADLSAKLAAAEHLGEERQSQGPSPVAGEAASS
jgi:hypothetical protein